MHRFEQNTFLESKERKNILRSILVIFKEHTFESCP